MLLYCDVTDEKFQKLRKFFGIKRTKNIKQYSDRIMIKFMSSQPLKIPTRQIIKEISDPVKFSIKSTKVQELIQLYMFNVREQNIHHINHTREGSTIDRLTDYQSINVLLPSHTNFRIQLMSLTFHFPFH